MQKKIYPLLVTLFTLACLWAVFFLTRLILEASPNRNLQHIPQDATFVARINGHKLLKDGFQTIVLEEDGSIITLLNDLYKRKSEEGAPSIRLGIDFNSDIIIFDRKFKGEHIRAVLFNLNDALRFEKNIDAFIHENQVASQKDQVGIILFSVIPEEETKLSKTDLKIQADQIMQNTFDFDTEGKLHFDEKNSLLKTWGKNGLIGDGEIVNSSNLQFDCYQNQLLVSGDLKMSLHKHDRLDTKIKPDGIHFTAKALSTGLKDSLSRLFQEFGLPTGQLCGISMNYYGLKIVEDPTFFVVPYFDALFKFEGDFLIKPSLDSLHSAGEITMEKDQFEFGGQLFYWKQISSNVVYIGLNHSPEFIANKGKEVVSLSGDLSQLTNVEGTGLMRQLLELLPKYSATKLLGSKLKNCEIKITSIEKNNYHLSGEITFENEEQVINALLSFLLESGALR